MRAAAVAALAASAAADPVVHGWGALKTMMWADYRAPNNLTDAEADFLANHYAVLSLEKCTGQSDGLATEDAQYATAQQLKAKNPDVKVFAYWGVDMQQAEACYRSAQRLRKEHPDYFLVDDKGYPVTDRGSHYAQLDFRQPAVREWWAAAPLSIGPDAGKFIDGILADGAGPRAKGPAFANFTPQELAALNAGRAQALGMTQGRFNQTNGGTVLCNGIDMYPPPNDAPDYNLGVLQYCDAIECEHFAAFESRNHKTGALNVTQVLINLDLIDRAAASGKSVLINMWPGKIVAPDGWPSGTPTTPGGWQAALSAHFNFSAAMFLAVAAPTVFFEYVAWYPVSQGVVPCPGCWAPTGWYPAVYKSVGQPKGPRKVTGTTITRSFEGVTVTVDLVTEKAALDWV